MKRYLTQFLTTIKIVFLIMGLLSCSLDASSLPKKYSSIQCASNGLGKIYFSWIVPPSFYPAGGWRLVDMRTKKVIVDSIKSQDSDFSTIMQKKRNLTKKDIKAQNMLMLKVMMDFEYAKSVGFALELNNIKAGSRKYKLIGLDKNNKKLIVLKSKNINSFIASKLPQRPKNLRAKVDGGAIKLFWDSPKNDKFMPFKYEVLRQNKDKSYTRVNDIVLTGIKWDNLKAVFTDPFAPYGRKVKYIVKGVDQFNRKSKPSVVTIFHEDPKSLKAPTNIVSKIKNRYIKISWQKNDNPFTVGYIIERGNSDIGFFTMLSKKPLKATSDYFIDKTAKEGVTYIYRVRSVNNLGKIGLPSKLTYIKFIKNTIPKPIKSLKAKIYPSMVKLIWRARNKNIAGYIVQKKYKTQAKWVRLNSDLILNTYYQDNFSLDAIGEVSYRVITVGTNGKNSKPSKQLNVNLLGKLDIYAPTITSIDGVNAKVVLKYSLSNVGAKANQVLVIRGNSSSDVGMVIATQNSKKDSYIDMFVRPGEDYWYALKAITKDKRESKISSKLKVRVSSAKIKTPKLLDVKYISKPFRHIKVSFEKAPKFMSTLIFVKSEIDNIWIKKDIALSKDFFIDTNIPKKGKISYKIVYQAQDGTTSAESKTITLHIK